MRVTGTWDDVFGAAPAEVAASAAAARAEILRLHPDTVEVARPGERSVTFGVGEAKMKEGYAYLMPHRAHANLGFFQGAALDDPEGLLEGTGKALRHVKLRTAEDARRPAVVALIGAAIAERRVALGGGA